MWLCRYIMSTFQPYGGLGWPLACLLPPSAISLFATVLLKLEGSQRGVQWDTLCLQMTSQYPFSAATVFQMLALDVVLYSALAWYLDNVSHQSSAGLALVHTPVHTKNGLQLCPIKTTDARSARAILE
jgi:hypothetical protein